MLPYSSIHTSWPGVECAVWQLAALGGFAHTERVSLLQSLPCPVTPQGPWQPTGLCPLPPLPWEVLHSAGQQARSLPKATFTLDLVFCKDFRAKQLQILNVRLPLSQSQPVGVAGRAGGPRQQARGPQVRAPPSGSSWASGLLGASGEFPGPGAVPVSPPWPGAHPQRCATTACSPGCTVVSIPLWLRWAPGRGPAPSSAGGRALGLSHAPRQHTTWPWPWPCALFW